MTLDRIIDIEIKAEGDRDDTGEFLPGMTTTSRVWATRMDRSLEDIEQEGGTRNIARRDYRVRWRSDIAGALPTNVTIADGAQVFQVSNLTEEEEAHGRRRFMVLECVGEAA